MSSAVDGSRTTRWTQVAWRRARQLAPRRSDWTSARPGRDLPAGLMVGLVALPLALGFGVSRYGRDGRTRHGGRGRRACRHLRW